MKFRSEQKVGGESGARADYWKRRPSEIKGYQKAYYINDSDGSYLRVDYHLKEKKLRLYLEDASETDRNCHFGFFAVSGQNSVFPPNYDCFRTPNN